MKKYRGFTLIELIVCVGIVALIAAIAFPAYYNSVRRTACDNGKAGLVQAAALMQQYYLQYGSYKNDASENFPITEIPIDGSEGKDFSVKLTNLKPTTFTLTATPLVTGRLGKFDGTLTIDEKSEKTSTLGGKDVWKDGCSSL